MKPLSRPVRRAALVVHVVVSVAWPGISLCLLALGVAGALSPPSSDEAAAAYGSMRVFGDWLLAPIALTSLLSGLVLSLGTPWGLARYRWVYAKFWLTLAATLMTLLAFRPAVQDAAALSAEGGTVRAAGMIAPPVVSLTLYVFLTAISVLKPWGPTRRGRRLREAARGARGAGAARRAGGARTAHVAREREDGRAVTREKAGAEDRAYDRNSVEADPAHQTA
ncbi:DUF2269 domain-containing protein [Streptomyces sp. NPDC054796]